jgi:glutamate/tyrosine decarboxylase-like PLP-dependent enzyme
LCGTVVRTDDPDEEFAMREPDWTGPLDEAYASALAYLKSLPGRPVGDRTTPGQMRAALGGPLPDGPDDARAVIAALATAAEPGLVASGSGRFFGFVFGGATPAALAADWLTSTWDQNAGLYAASPAASVIEEVTAAWLLDLLGLPPTASVGFVTGAQMAAFTGLAAARHEMLRRAGWPVEARGLFGAPPIRVLAGADRHDTIDRALRFLGIGTDAIVPVAVDAEGRMTTSGLAAALDAHADGNPVIVCTEVGNVNSGSVDPVGALCDIAHAAGAWVHVDGAFGLWAAASPALRSIVDGADRADSWSTDAHKLLNVPYDSGLAIVANPAAHRAAMGVRAAYLIHSEGERDQVDYNPEFSRRARGIPVYAALRSLGRVGVADLVERCCGLARRFATRLAAADGVEILNEVTLNQVLVRFGGDDALTRRVVEAVRHEGTCFLTGTTWHGVAAMRVSVSNWSTDEADVDRSVATILSTAAAAA